MGYFRWGARTAELSSCSSAQVLQPGSAGWEGMQHPRSILAAPRSRAAVAPAGRSQHCQRILLLPSFGNRAAPAASKIHDTKRRGARGIPGTRSPGDLRAQPIPQPCRRNTQSIQVKKIISHPYLLFVFLPCPASTLCRYKPKGSLIISSAGIEVISDKIPVQPSWAINTVKHILRTCL